MAFKEFICKNVILIFFQKTDTQNDFDELVNYVRENAPKLPTVIENVVKCSSTKINTSKNVTNQGEMKVEAEIKKATVLPMQDIDPRKYYIYKTDDDDKNQKFEGQSFIGFDQGQEHLTISNVEIVNGVRQTSNQKSRISLSYGIKPSVLDVSSNDIVSVKVFSGSVKRKHSKLESSTYKSITIREMSKKPKLKQSRQTKKLKTKKK